MFFIHVRQKIFLQNRQVSLFKFYDKYLKLLDFFIDDDELICHLINHIGEV